MGWQTHWLVKKKRKRKITVTSLPLKPHIAVHDKVHFRSLGRGPDRSPPTHRSVTPITRGFVLVHFDSLPDHYTSKHTRKQVNPIQHTQSKIRGPKGAVQKRSRCPLFFSCSDMRTVGLSNLCSGQWRKEKKIYIYIKKKRHVQDDGASLSVTDF